GVIALNGENADAGMAFHLIVHSRGIATPTLLPSPRLKKFLLFDGRGGKALHGAGDLLADFGQDLGIVVVRCRSDDGLGTADGFFALLGVMLHIEWRGALLHKDS